MNFNPNSIGDNDASNCNALGMARVEKTTAKKVAVVGLGYVGLPLALALSRNNEVIGVDVDANRISELKTGVDRTNEVPEEVLKNSCLRYTTDANVLQQAEIIIVAVPTPVDDNNDPDLALLISACRNVGEVLSSGTVVVFESTVYPGVTEEVCGPELERASGLVCGRDFFLGYSPERINPGDQAHTVDKITKVVAGQTPQVTDLLAGLYGSMTAGGVFKAANIRTAEAAKVIENAQRDINIAFVNEIATIFNRIGLNSEDVLAAARTKWNFLDFRPGLVGGHCIGIDPYYLAHLARANGHEPEVILSGRRINDRMPDLIAEMIDNELRRYVTAGKEGSVLVLGLAFKENVPDIRNSKTVDLIRSLAKFGHRVFAHDPLVDAAEVKAMHGIDLVEDLENCRELDAVVGAVPHRAYAYLNGQNMARFLKPNGLVADIKGQWRLTALPDGLRRWEL